MSYDYVDNAVVKKPKDDVPLTEEQAIEFEKCAFDVEYWVKNYLAVQTNTGKQLFNPRPYQQRTIDGLLNNQFVVALMPRQSGKSQTAVAYLLHSAIFFPDQQIGITSYKLSNVKDLLDRARYGLEGLPRWMAPGVREYNKFSIRFTNNSSIVGEVTNESTFRGKSLNLIFVDELAFVKPSVAEEFWSGLLPSMTAGGEGANTKLIITSTPNGTGNLFANLWFGAKMGTNGFHAVEVKYSEPPGRTPEFKKQMLKKMSKEKFQQEYECKFVSSKATLINSIFLEAIPVEEPVEVIGDELSLFTDNLSGKKIAIAIDVGEGVGADYHVVQIFSLDPLVQVGEFRNNTMTQTEFAKEIVKIIKLVFDMGADEVYWSLETNGIGRGVANLLENSSNSALDRAVFVSQEDSRRPGITMTAKSKALGCSIMKDMVESERMTLKSDRLLTELKFFIKSKGSFAAESGMHDDLAMGCVILCLLLQELSMFEENLYDQFNEVSIDLEDEGYEVGIFF